MSRRLKLTTHSLLIYLDGRLINSLNYFLIADALSKLIYQPSEEQNYFFPPFYSSEMCRPTTSDTSYKPAISTGVLMALRYTRPGG